ncbi:hypothetical protein HNO88_003278 [Novosphingobium chloroacetimidivorans]|uniref:Uncharacterized protein n=1 Tax=Novosphingobium chloroacetimidivorans TaxID=1428314 RepID=A0A7W7KBU8_9SPHN|nr:hypothetical protein [Novosphingobium chloroacetimidivorans]
MKLPHPCRSLQVGNAKNDASGVDGPNFAS